MPVALRRPAAVCCRDLVLVGRHFAVAVRVNSGGLQVQAVVAGRQCPLSSRVIHHETAADADPAKQEAMTVYRRRVHAIRKVEGDTHI